MIRHLLSVWLIQFDIWIGELRERSCKYCHQVLHCVTSYVHSAALASYLCVSRVSTTTTSRLIDIVRSIPNFTPWVVYLTHHHRFIMSLRNDGNDFALLQTVHNHSRRTETFHLLYSIWPYEHSKAREKQSSSCCSILTSRVMVYSDNWTNVNECNEHLTFIPITMIQSSTIPWKWKRLQTILHMFEYLWTSL